MLTPDTDCSHAHFAAAARPSAATRVVNWSFYRVRGACVANWENPEGGPAYTAVAVTPEVLLAATALEPTFSASRQFIASASLGHLPKGSLLLASPRPVAKRSCGTR
jgi:hypothetical protein